MPLVLIALAQMFVVGGSEIDLGAGAFAGLCQRHQPLPAAGGSPSSAAALTAGLAAMPSWASSSRPRAIPAIVVTLGASFIWIRDGADAGKRLPEAAVRNG
ncbi:hypothetical protein F2981_24260 (plasmid) [Sinorhizobium meliloti]|nr:hypothetical protein [Sinorhizobium meliloti]